MWGCFVIDDYELPDVERIVEAILDGLVPEGQLGPIKIETFDTYMNLMHGESPPLLDLTAYDYIQINRKQGYLTDSFTDISGLDVEVWSKSRSRSVKLMDKVTKRLLAANGETFWYTDRETGKELDFLVDFCVVLNGPETDRIELMEETMTGKSFELHIRVKWKD